MQKGERGSVKQMFVQTGGVQRHTVRWWWWWWGSKLMLNKQESNHSNENEFQEVAGGSCPRRSTEYRCFHVTHTHTAVNNVKLCIHANNQTL